MATSKCPKCGSSRFEMVENVPEKSIYKLMFVQCSSCGTVIGCTDYYNIPALLNKIAKKLGINIL